MAERDASVRLRRAVQREQSLPFYRFRFINAHLGLEPPLSPIRYTENNLFLVKRLIKRIDMRNPDPNIKRYTSLAWAAILGCEETFEFLLSQGHDDEEFSKVCSYV